MGGTRPVSTEGRTGLRRAPRAAASILIPIAALGGTASAADFRLQLYGVVDLAAQAVRQGGEFSGRIESGLAGTSRWGLQAQEDLGNGLYAGIWLEAPFRADTGGAGTPTTQGDFSFFSRQSSIALGSPTLGEIRLGRQLPAQINPLLDTFAGVVGFSPLASLAAMGRDQGAGASIGDSRISNAVSYATPETWALGGTAEIALRESSAPGYRSLSAYGLEVHYTLADWFFQVQAMFNNTDPTPDVPSFRNGWYGFAAKKEFAGMTAAYIVSVLRPEREGYAVSQTHSLSLTIAAGDGTFRLSPVYRHVAGHSELDAFALGAGYDLNLSKRTTLYTRLGYVANHAKAAATLGTIPPGSPGDDLSTLALGMRMRF